MGPADMGPGDPTLRIPTGMSMVLSNWIITPIKVGCKSRK